MPPGKLASQAGHAFLDSFLDCLHQNPERAAMYRGDAHGTKVALHAKTLDHLLRAHRLACEAGLPCALITDSGHVLPPHFTGEPIITALGIGPALREEARRITGRFALVP